MKNKNNIQSPQKFNPPTQHDVYVDGKFSGVCLVHDPAAWRHKNKPRTEQAAPNKTPKSDLVKRAANYSDVGPIPGRV